MDLRIFKSLDQDDSLINRVKSSLEEAILQNKVKPGERLIENELAKSFKISRGPIREAFRLLENDGFIEIVPRKGAVVRNISNEDITEIYQVRSVLEGLASRLFCMKAEQEELESLERIFKRMKTYIENGNIAGYSKSNMEFHGVIMEKCNNSRILGIFNNIRKQIIWFQNLTLSFVGRPEISLEEHRDILDAFFDKDCHRAEREAKRHIVRALELYQETINQGG